MGICCITRENSDWGSVRIQRGGMGREMGGRFRPRGDICIPMADS